MIPRGPEILTAYSIPTHDTGIIPAYLKPEAIYNLHFRIAGERNIECINIHSVDSPATKTRDAIVETSVNKCLAGKLEML